MPKARRNDPCPCGSGKKYKNCCMRQDRTSDSRQYGLDAAEGFMLNTLYQFAQSQRFALDLTDGFAFYWGGRYDLDVLSEIEPEDMQRTFEWFIHDYHTTVDDRYVIDLFVERDADQFTPDAKEILNAWSHSVMGLFRMLEATGSALVRLYDLLRKSEVEVHDRTLAHTAQRGDLLVGRVFELGGVQRLSLMAALLPGDYETGLVDYVQNARALFLDEHPGSSWDEFLRENGHIFSAYLLSSRAESLRALIGPGTRFHDPAITRDKMRQFTTDRQQERRQEKARAEAEIPRTHRTASGLILPGAVEEPQSREKEKAQEAEAPRILIPGRDA